ncbi:MAG: hypothetical protein WCY49_07060 [Anaerovoracaceae bacterium]
MYVYRDIEPGTQVETLKIVYSLPTVHTKGMSTILGFNKLSPTELRKHNYFPLSKEIPQYGYREIPGPEKLIFNESTQTYTLTREKILLTEEEWNSKIDAMAVAMAYEADDMHRAFMNTRYPIERWVYFLNLKMIAYSVGCVEAINTLAQLEHWKGVVLSYFYEVEAEIYNTAMDVKTGVKLIDDLEALRATWDFEQFSASDPKIFIPMVEGPLYDFMANNT